MDYVTCDTNHEYIVNRIKDGYVVELMYIYKCDVQYAIILNDFLPDVISNLISDYCRLYNVYKLTPYAYVTMDLCIDVNCGTEFITSFGYIVNNDSISISSYPKSLPAVCAIINWLTKKNENQ